MQVNQSLDLGIKSWPLVLGDVVPSMLRTHVGHTLRLGHIMAQAGRSVTGEHASNTKAGKPAPIWSWKDSG